jgi:hypothetical protein
MKLRKNSGEDKFKFGQSNTRLRCLQRGVVNGVKPFNHVSLAPAGQDDFSLCQHLALFTTTNSGVPVAAPGLWSDGRSILSMELSYNDMDGHPIVEIIQAYSVDGTNDRFTINSIGIIDKTNSTYYTFQVLNSFTALGDFANQRYSARSLDIVTAIDTLDVEAASGLLALGDVVDLRTMIVPGNGVLLDRWDDAYSLISNRIVSAINDNDGSLADARTATTVVRHSEGLFAQIIRQLNPEMIGRRQWDFSLNDITRIDPMAWMTRAQYSIEGDSVLTQELTSSEELFVISVTNFVEQFMAESALEKISIEFDFRTSTSSFDHPEWIHPEMQGHNEDFFSNDLDAIFLSVEAILHSEHKKGNMPSRQTPDSGTEFDTITPLVKMVMMLDRSRLAEINLCMENGDVKKIELPLYASGLFSLNVLPDNTSLAGLARKIVDVVGESNISSL